MTRSLELEDFGQAVAPDPSPTMTAPVQPPETGPDSVGLEAFEQGYRNGWDDCIANETEERRRVSADLAATLQEIDASADAIRKEMLNGLAPLLEQIATQLLPVVAAEAVAPLLVSEIERIAAEQCAIELQLLVAPATVPVVENLLVRTDGLEVTVTPEPALAEGQVSLRFAGQRRDIDMTEATNRMAEAIRRFVDEMIRESHVSGNSHEDMQDRGVA
jgi:flagellar assembly protein FliH